MIPTPTGRGTLPFAFEPGMGFERYVDYALDVPMYFLKRGSTYFDVAGASFRDLLDGRLAGHLGERATIADWANHLSTIFPEVRLKRYLEMRGADVGPSERIVAMTALTAGLFYDRDALASASALIGEWSARGTSGFARRRSEARLGSDDRRPDAEGGRARHAELGARRTETPRPARRRRSRRDEAPSAARGDRGERTVAGRVWIERFKGPWRAPSTRGSKRRCSRLRTHKSVGGLKDL